MILKLPFNMIMSSYALEYVLPCTICGSSIDKNLWRRERNRHVLYRSSEQWTLKAVMCAGKENWIVNQIKLLHLAWERAARELREKRELSRILRKEFKHFWDPYQFDFDSCAPSLLVLGFSSLYESALPLSTAGSRNK